MSVKKDDSLDICGCLYNVTFYVEHGTTDCNSAKMCTCRVKSIDLISLRHLLPSTAVLNLLFLKRKDLLSFTRAQCV